ncbi:uncharacterized protein LOC143292038 [Babylonia areolata]|uniref:uncharacterized protein LOC143292038 n=1 Tax=Babylonia areolata TaxID=304850 RepID=UPI003FD3FEE7
MDEVNTGFQLTPRMEAVMKVYGFSALLVVTAANLLAWNKGLPVDDIGVEELVNDCQNWLRNRRDQRQQSQLAASRHPNATAANISTSPASQTDQSGAVYMLSPRMEAVMKVYGFSALLVVTAANLLAWNNGIPVDDIGVEELVNYCQLFD